MIMGIMLDGGNLASAARILLPRFIEFTILFLVITQMWTGIAWFPAMLNWGLAQASHLTNTPIPTVALSVSSSNTIDASSFDQIPGILVSIGGNLYHIVMKGTDDGNSGIWGWIKRLGGLVTGNTEMYMVLVVYLWLTALHALGAMTYAALRVTASIINALLLTPMSFLQATLGSRRLASLGGGYINGTIIMMLELMLTILIAGLGIIVINGLASALSWTLTYNVADCPPLLPTCFGTSIGMTVADASLINIAVGFVAYMITRVPKTIADILAGRLTMSGSEVNAVMKSMSGNPVGFALSSAGSAIEGTAKGGVGAGFAAGTEGIRNIVGSAAKLGIIAAVGAATGGTGLAAIGEAGAMGGMLGGAPGMLAGAAGKLLRSHAGAGVEAPDSGGTIDASPISTPTSSANASSNENGTSGQASDSANASPSTSTESVQTSRAGTVNTDWTQQDGTPPSSPHAQAINETFTRNITSNSNQMGGTSGDIGGGPQGTVGAGAPPNASTSGLSGMLRDLNPGMSIGRMFAQRMIYGQSRPTPPPPTPPEESTTSHISPFG